MAIVLIDNTRRSEAGHHRFVHIWECPDPVPGPCPDRATDVTAEEAVSEAWRRVLKREVRYTPGLAEELEDGSYQSFFADLKFVGNRDFDDGNEALSAAVETFNAYWGEYGWHLEWQCSYDRRPGEPEEWELEKPYDPANPPGPQLWHDMVEVSRR
jgi:hypothetical protein